MPPLPQSATSSTCCRGHGSKSSTWPPASPVGRAVLAAGWVETTCTTHYDPCPLSVLLHELGLFRNGWSKITGYNHAVSLWSLHCYYFSHTWFHIAPLQCTGLYIYIYIYIQIYNIYTHTGKHVQHSPQLARGSLCLLGHDIIAETIFNRLILKHTSVLPSYRICTLTPLLTLSVE